MVRHLRNIDVNRLLHDVWVLQVRLVWELERYLVCLGAAFGWEEVALELDYGHGRLLNELDTCDPTRVLFFPQFVVDRQQVVFLGLVHDGISTSTGTVS